MTLFNVFEMAVLSRPNVTTTAIVMTPSTTAYSAIVCPDSQSTTPRSSSSMLKLLLLDTHASTCSKLGIDNRRQHEDHPPGGRARGQRADGSSIQSFPGGKTCSARCAFHPATLGRPWLSM